MKRNHRPPPLVNLQLFCWKGDLHPFGVDHKRNSNDCIGTIILISALTTNSRTTKSFRAVAFRAGPYLLCPGWSTLSECCLDTRWLRFPASLKLPLLVSSAWGKHRDAVQCQWQDLEPPELLPQWKATNILFAGSKGTERLTSLRSNFV